MCEKTDIVTGTKRIPTPAFDDAYNLLRSPLYLPVVQDQDSMVQQRHCNNFQTIRQGNRWFSHQMMKFEAVFLLTELVGWVSNGRAGNVAGALMETFRQI